MKKSFLIIIAVMSALFMVTDVFAQEQGRRAGGLFGNMRRSRQSRRAQTQAQTPQNNNVSAVAPRVNSVARPSRIPAQQASVPGMTEADLDKVPRGTNGVPMLAFNQAPLELVLTAYGEQAGKTIIPAPDIPKTTTITLKSLEGQTLTKEEYLDAILVTLTMNGIVLEPFGDKFLRAFSRKTVRTQGIPILMNTATNALPEKGQVVSQVIRLTNITAKEAEEAIKGFLDPSGLMQVFERNNSILVTDIQENINRMLEIIRELDVATPVVEDVFVRQIKFAVAADIKTALETIVQESQNEKESDKVGTNKSGSPGFGRQSSGLKAVGLLNRNNIPGAQNQQQPNSTMTAAISDADRGMIRGKVLIVSDERSNKLIIITAKSNMDFFDRVIESLDVETTPDVKVEVVRLKYADAEEVSSMLNDLIGASSGSSSSNQKNAPQNQAKGPSKTNLTTARNTSRAGASNNPSFSKTANLGELNKDNVKILADKRINGVVVMARTADMKAVKQVIEDMDVKLSQVLIETVILQVELGDDLKTGVDWIQRGKTTTYQKNGTHTKQYSGYTSATAENGPPGYTSEAVTEGDSTVYRWFKWVDNYSPVTTRGNVFNNGDMLGGGGGSASGTLASFLGVAGDAAVGAATNGTLASALLPTGSGINYFLKSDKLNLAAIIQASKTDSRTKVLASPIIMTVDNKEATIEATDMIYLFSGYQYSGSSMYGSQVRNYEKRDIGLTVKVTPRINPNGTVVLTIEQTFETQGADQSVPNEQGGTDPYATVTTRKLSSDISVENRQTIVMGGLTKKTNVESESGIPILKDIPYIGKWLFGSVSTKEARSELLVFMTPYVLDDAESAQAEAARRKRSLSVARPWEDNGWSTSPLADPISKKEQLRRFKDEWKRQDEERNTRLEIEKAKIARAKKLKEMSESERNMWIKLNEKLLDEELEEKKKKEEEEQKDYRKIVEDIKKRRLGDAEKEIEKSKVPEQNEYKRLNVEGQLKDKQPPTENTEQNKQPPAATTVQNNLLSDLSTEASASTATITEGDKQ